jgi:syntaxin 16
MKDLASLVIDQGTVLDRVDYQLEAAAGSVAQGVGQLRRAERAQRRGFAATCVLVLLAAVAAMFCVLLLKAALS